MLVVSLYYQACLSTPRTRGLVSAVVGAACPDVSAPSKNRFYSQFFHELGDVVS